jgi:hypothetical protein
MLIGGASHNDNEVRNQGFAEKKSLTILGMKISNNLDVDIQVSADHITRKIVENINRWERFNLSLPGRIQIAKTMLYSQINYLGCFLNFSNNTLLAWESLIHNYVKANLNVSKQRAFLPVEFGGLGLFDLKNFLDSQKIRWVVSADREINAEWKANLERAAISEFYRYDMNCAANESSLLNTMCKAFLNLKKKYISVDNNYMKLAIFGETLFTVNLRSNDFFNLGDLNTVDNLEVREKLIALRLNEVHSNGISVSIQAMERLCRGPVPVPVYDKIVKICTTAKVRFHNGIPITGVKFETFFGSWKKGSKKFRNILQRPKTISLQHNTIKFASNMETVIDINCSLKLNRDWCRSYLSNQMRTFIFKLHNNTLPINTMLSHFVRGKSRNCTFCELARNPDPVDESAYHLFYDCPTTELLKDNFFKWLTKNNTFTLNRHEYFCCGPVIEQREIWTTIIYIFKFFVWESKQINALPTLDRLKIFFTKEMGTIRKINKSLNLKFENLNFAEEQEVG